MAHFYQGIGKRIKKLREEKGYSQGKLAARINIEKEMLMAFEDGRRRIFADHISRLSEVLGVTIDYLIYGNEKKNE